MKQSIKTQLSKITPIGTIMFIFGSFTVFALVMWLINMVTKFNPLYSI